MDWSIDAETEKMLWHLAIQNAVEYDGKGSPGSVIGRVMSIRQDLRQYGKIISPMFAQNVAGANQLAAEKGIEHLIEILENEAPDLLQEREKKERRAGLPELNNITNRKIVLRFAPNPNGPLSFGHARGITINGEYAKKYDKKGKILEFQQYPVEIVDSKNKLNKKNQSYKFVFCGILIAPDDQTQPKELFNSAGLHN